MKKQTPPRVPPAGVPMTGGPAGGGYRATNLCLVIGVVVQEWALSGCLCRFDLLAFPAESQDALAVAVNKAEDITRHNLGAVCDVQRRRRSHVPHGGPTW